MSSDASRFYYLRLMSRKTSNGGRPTEVTRPKFVQWSGDVQYYPVSLEEHPELENEAMKIVRTVGQAFDLCQKKTSDNRAIEDEQQKASSEERLSPMPAYKAGSSLSLPPTLIEPVTDEESEDQMMPSTSAYGTSGSDVSPYMQQQRPLTPLEVPAPTADKKLSRKMSPAPPASQPNSPGDWIRQDHKGVQISTSLAESNVRITGQAEQPSQLLASMNIPSAFSYPGPGSPFAVMSGSPGHRFLQQQQQQQQQQPQAVPESLLQATHSSLTPGILFGGGPFVSWPQDFSGQSQFSANSQLISPSNGVESKLCSGGSMMTSSVMLQEDIEASGAFSPPSTSSGPKNVALQTLTKQFYLPLSSTNLNQQQINAVFQGLLAQQQQQMGISTQQQRNVMTSSWAEGILSSGTLSHNVENQSINLLRNQLEYAQKQAQVSIAHVYLLRDQLASETTARIESQARTQQLVQANKELVEQVQVLVARLQNLETRLSSQILSTASASFLPDEAIKPKQPAKSSRLDKVEAAYAQQTSAAADGLISRRSVSPKYPRVMESSTLSTESLQHLQRPPERYRSKSPSVLAATTEKPNSDIHGMNRSESDLLSPIDERLKIDRIKHKNQKQHSEKSPFDRTDERSRKFSDSVITRHKSSKNTKLLAFKSSKKAESVEGERLSYDIDRLQTFQNRDDNYSDTENSTLLTSYKSGRVKSLDEQDDILYKEPEIVSEEYQKRRMRLKNTRSPYNSHSLGASRNRRPKLTDESDRKTLAFDDTTILDSPRSTRKCSSDAGFSAKETELHELIKRSNLTPKDVKKVLQNHLGSQRATSNEPTSRFDPVFNEVSSEITSSSSSEEGTQKATFVSSSSKRQVVKHSRKKPTIGNDDRSPSRSIPPGRLCLGAEQCLGNKFIGNKATNSHKSENFPIIGEDNSKRPENSLYCVPSLSKTRRD